VSGPPPSLRARTQASPDRRRALFGGEGEVSVLDVTPRDAPFRAVLSCVLAPGGRVGRHRQEGDDEIVFCLAGEGAIVVDDEAHHVRPGDVVFVARGAVLSIENLSVEEPLDYAIVKVAAR